MYDNILLIVESTVSGKRVDSNKKADDLHCEITCRGNRKWFSNFGVKL